MSQIFCQISYLRIPHRQVAQERKVAMARGALFNPLHNFTSSARNIITQRGVIFESNLRRCFGAGDIGLIKRVNAKCATKECGTPLP
jgi:hypothetical protein